jgi:hypothetical protein
MRLPFYDNNEGYRAGISLVYMCGLNVRLFDSLIPSLALTGLNRTRDKRNDREVNDSGGEWIYLTPGLAYVFTRKPLKGLSLFVNAQVPVYQFLHGTQLAEDFNFTIGVAYRFTVI